MRLTRRGKAGLVVVVLGVVMARVFGAQALGVIVIPVLVAVVGAAVQVRRAGRPDVTRRVPDPGFIDETKRVTLSFDVGSPVAATVEDHADAGLELDGAYFEATLGTRDLAYDATYCDRGEHDFGPLSVRIVDVLGLAEAEHRYGHRDSVLVYPRVYALTGSTRHDLNLLPEGGFEHNREEFENLREYDRGDSLRDVHWKSSAKRAADDLVVKQFVSEEDVGDVHIACESADGWDDHVAEATASIALYLLDSGIRVGLSAPNGELEADAGADQREALLALLATVGPGKVPDEHRERANVVVTGSESTGVRVEMADREVPFSSFVRDEPTREEVRA
ncbi:DUF58 domain-containing protein [Halorubellus sp. PRR65]|uniref:DUF58 domain-containing protein n=1 Tax=Halorubellus sp. PRR65 TaxID=3098148 RepID=UPI002B25CE78|nr:DUF58 domain-containing protein [Halorubellus sp. PRR65]